MRRPQPGDPKWLQLAFTNLGTKEGPGKVNNKKVLEFYLDAGHPEIGHDSVPWCGAFVGAMLARAGMPLPINPLAARNWLNWGKATDKPKRGDVVIFKRGTGWQGHVAFYLGETDTSIVHLGGNQSDAVTITSTPKSKLLGYRTTVSLKTSNGLKAATASMAGVGLASLGEAAEPVAQFMTDTSTTVQGVSTFSTTLLVIGVLLAVGGSMFMLWARIHKWNKEGV
jgi:uncharacterized protein (TIGR02594 family)